MNERSHPKAVEPQLTTNVVIRKLAEANPDLADALKSKFPEAFEDEYLSFENAKGLPDYVFRLEEAACDAGVGKWQGLFVNKAIDVIVKPLPNYWDNATAILFKRK